MSALEFQHTGCEQFPLCLGCQEIVEDGDLPYRVCTGCNQIEWDEFNSCTECDNEMIHECKTDHWHCSDEICYGITKSEAEDGMIAEYELEQAGGLDAVQEKERENYYVSKYGEY